MNGETVLSRQEGFQKEGVVTLDPDPEGFVPVSGAGKRRKGKGRLRD